MKDILHVDRAFLTMISIKTYLLKNHFDEFCIGHCVEHPKYLPWYFSQFPIFPLGH